MQYFLNIIFIGLLIAVSVNDIRRMEIPDGLNLLILVLGVVRLMMIAVTGGWQACGEMTADSLLGLIIVSIPLALIAVVTKGAVGGGDIKLVGACGFYLGSRAVLHGAMIGFLLGGAYAAIRMLMSNRKKRKQALQTCFALGPFLCAGMVLSMMYV